MSKTVIEMHDIVKTYYIGTPNELEVLHGISLEIHEGEFVSIVGASGSGKSTLMNIIGALDHQTSGEYTLDGVPMTEMNSRKLSQIRNRKIGFVFQTFNLIPRSTAQGNVELPMLYAGIPKRERSKRAKELLAMVEMSERAKHMPNELSGGQKQRVAIAGVIAMRPKCIVLDEPTAMLDPNGRREVLRTVEELRRQEKVTVILITHYMEEVIDADKVFVMDHGHVVMEGTPREIFSQVDTLKSYRLDVPQVTILADELQKRGIPVPAGILRKEELVEALCRLK